MTITDDLIQDAIAEAKCCLAIDNSAKVRHTSAGRS